MPWVFSYSDLGPQILEKVLNRAPFCALPATLPRYKVVFKGRSRKWGGALATLEKSSKSFVYGSALLLPVEELKLIDRYYQSFEQVQVPIFIDATQDKVKAYAYVKKANDYGVPSQDYITAITKHLKFFWGQGGGRSPSLEDFGISIDVPNKQSKIQTVKKQSQTKTKPKTKQRRKRTTKSR
jgi:hypothetical protein